MSFDWNKRKFQIYILCIDCPTFMIRFPKYLIGGFRMTQVRQALPSSRYHMLKPLTRLIADLRAENFNEKSSKRERSRKIKNVIVLGLLMAFPVLCFNLGNWQYRRLQWKTDIIYKLKDRISSPPTDILEIVIPTEEDAIKEFEDDLMFTKFKLRGRFLHQEELFVGPRVREEIRGYIVYTPFVITSEGPNKGKKVIVERGFVGEKKVSPTARMENNRLSYLALPVGEVEIECCLRRKVKPGKLALDNGKDIRLLAYTDIYDMARRTGSIPIYLQQMADLTDGSVKAVPEYKSKGWRFWEAPEEIHQDIHEFTKNQFLRNGVPLGNTPDIDIRNNHLEYLITWYSLAIISSVLIFFVVRKKKVNPIQEKLKHAQKLQ